MTSLIRNNENTKDEIQIQRPTKKKAPQKPTTCSVRRYRKKWKKIGLYEKPFLLNDTIYVTKRERESERKAHTQ